MVNPVLITPQPSSPPDRAALPFARESGSVESPLAAARRVADTIAALAAPAVDRDARFPVESVSALRDARLLSALVPEKLGGLGCSLRDVVAMTERLGRRCAATGMVFAMHQIQVACLVRHARTPHFGRYLERLALEQRLIASVTSELGVGGDLRKSIAAVEADGPSVRFEKRAPTVSYGAHADDLLVTLRRSPDAAPSDQVLVLVGRPDFSLEPSSEWNTLGMRGTCSPGYIVRATFAKEQILTEPFADIAYRTMVPISHLLWASVWLGIAADALGRAHAFIRGEARRQPGAMPAGAMRLAEAAALLDTLRARVQATLAEYETLSETEGGVEELSSVAWSTRVNALKLAASELVVDIVTRALRIIGMAGYKEQGELSVARHLRDAHSAALMIGNDRIYAANAALLLVQKEVG